MERSKTTKVNFLKRINVLLLAIILLASILRLWNITKVPVSLFGDELDVGYQALSILKTGRDYSGNFMPFDFQGLAEWRTPLYLYSSVPTVALFGISPLGVRLPAVIFGILTIPLFYSLAKHITKSRKVGLIASLLLAISPWHLQYSRAGFEVTELLLLLILGLLIFFKSIKLNGKYLWLSLFCFILTAWTYNTAKLFTPLFITLIAVIYRREILRFSKRNLVTAGLLSFLVSLPIIYSTFLGGGAQRIGDINIFKQPINETLMAESRAYEKSPAIAKVFVNKYTIYSGVFLRNYLSPLSVDFLFLNGDINPRHSIEGMGEFYWVELVALLIGISFFFLKNIEKRFKIIILAWLFLGILPSSLTVRGSTHATRLILILPPIMLLIAFGWNHLLGLFKPMYLKYTLLILVGVVYLFSFISYEHMYLVDNPIQSEKWWHYGWEESIKAAVNDSHQYKDVIISTKGEPPWIFFAAWSQFDPATWHKGYPFSKHVIEGFGEMSYISNYSFGSPQIGGIYDWGKVISPNILYVANASEINVDLLHNPETLPSDLVLVKTVIYPSGMPAFYLLTHKQ